MSFLACAPGSSAVAAELGCGQFIQAIARAAGDAKLEFARGLSVGGFGGGYDYYDVPPEEGVETSLVCRNERFVRFEARAPAQISARGGARFERIQAAALQAAAGQDRGRASATIQQMTREAREYLSGSQQRGDVVVAGKVERHLGAIDLGLFVTEVDRTLIVSSGS